MKPTNRNLGFMMFVAVAAMILLLGYAGDSVAQSQRRSPDGDGRQSRPPDPPMLDLDGNGKLSYKEASKAPFINRECFSCLDKNNDNFLDQEEFPPPPRRGKEGKPQDRAESTRDGRSQQEYGQRPSRPERDADGKLTYEEALKIRFFNEATFACFDKDGDGVLSRQEFPPLPQRAKRGNSGEKRAKRGNSGEGRGMSGEPGEGRGKRGKPGR